MFCLIYVPVVSDDLVQVELELKQQLSAPLPADTVEYESTQLLARPAVAAAGPVVEDATTAVNAVRSMGRIVSKDSGTSAIDLSWCNAMHRHQGVSCGCIDS